MLGLSVIGFGLDDFVKHVLPALAERGYHDMAQAGSPSDNISTCHTVRAVMFRPRRLPLVEGSS
jgi:hypothetical protein